MLWLSGLLIAMLIGVVVWKRKPAPDPEQPVAEQDDLASLMQDDLAWLSSNANADAPPDVAGREMTEEQTQDLMKALHADAEVAYGAPAAENAPILFHDAKTAELILLWDDDACSEPSVTVAADPDTPDMTDIFMDGDLVARVACARRVDADEVSLMPQSLASDLGLMAKAS